MPTKRSYPLLALQLATLTLTAALLLLVRPASAQVDRPCATQGAVADADNNPGLVSDCEALLAARDTLAGTATLNWSASTHISEWDGIVLEGSPKRVALLILTGKGLTGRIPAELGGLDNLRGLFFDDNQLSGEIPPELGGITNLSGLHLENNKLTGKIPTELGGLANLRRLYLAGNQLTGDIPKELGSLVNLDTLDLYFNRLTGKIPKDLGGLTNLRWLSLASNQLTGGIPAELGGIFELRQISVHGNQLTGEIPRELGSLGNLQTLSLGSNQLTGEIPAELGGLTNLIYLSISRNQLTDEIPEELGGLSNLETLSLGSNQLAGKIPARLGGLAKLKSLDVSDNKLTGEIPVELGDLTNLEYLSLSYNQLTGEIPVELSKLANLATLYLSRNQLTGKIPGELGHLAKLKGLIIGDNQLTGCIPQALQGVRSNEFLNLPLPFCDVLLSRLTVKPGSMTPTFDPFHAEYSFAEGRSLITVAPVNDHNATIHFLDEYDNPLVDADDAMEGFQVEFNAYVPAIKIRVLSEDNLVTHTYKVSDLVIRYDVNEDGVIDRDEVMATIADYFSEHISKQEASEIFGLYFFGIVERALAKHPFLYIQRSLKTA